MRAVIFVISLATSWTTVVLSGLFAASLQEWFGVSDLSFLAICFLPLSFLAAFISVSVFPRVSSWGLLLRYVLGIGLGLGVGFVWTWCVARLLGPWWGAVSLPALMCWMAGGAAGIAGGLALGPGSSARSRVASVIGLLGLAGAAVVVNEPLGIHLRHDQTLTVRFLRWTPGDGPLTLETERMFETEREDELSDTELALIRSVQPTGRLVLLWGGSKHGRGPAASALIVLKEPITMPVTLRQPDRADALYVQDAHGFVMHPAHTKTLDREITLSQYQGGVWCSVRIASGGTQSGPVRVW